MEREFSGRSPFLSGPLLIPLGAGEKFDTGRLGTQWKIDGPQTGGRFSVVHHQLPPRTLAAPLHRHHREDEHSYVLTGTFGALLGDDVVTAEPGTWVFKPHRPTPKRPASTSMSSNRSLNTRRRPCSTRKSTSARGWRESAIQALSSNSPSF